MPSTPHRCMAVRSATEQYDIHIGPGVLADVGEQVVALTPGRKAFVLSHPQLYKLYGATLVDSLRAVGFGVETCLVPEGERSKSLLAASRLFTRLARGGADRHSVVCALGGASWVTSQGLSPRPICVVSLWCRFLRLCWPWWIVVWAAKPLSITS